MLNDLKLILGITDNQMDDRLQWILETTQARLSVLLGGDSVPDELEHVVTEVSVIRFNRLGSEGLSNHTVEGESMSYLDDDFAPFMSEINAYLDTVKNGKGRVRFI